MNITITVYCIYISSICNTKVIHVFKYGFKLGFKDLDLTKKRGPMRIKMH